MTGAREAQRESKTRLYQIWLNMRRRCNNPSDQAFPNYGGRGITVCPEWDNSYLAFRDWALANGYAKNLTIDRKNNNGHYTPCNCRWATYAEQNRNYRRNRSVQHEGKEWLICDLAPLYGLPQDIVKNRIFRYGWAVQKALTTPIHKRSETPIWEQAGMSRSTYYRRRSAAITFKLAN